MTKISYAGYRFPPEVIHQAIWLYLRFTLSFRDVEDLLAERGIMVSYETVRRWVNHFGPIVAADLRKRRPKPHSTWHLDEVYLKIGGRMVYLWRAVDAEGEVLGVAAVNFARKNNLRLVVKGGGHSYQGTSNAADSLLIWTRHMDSVVLHDAFLGAGCAGSAEPQPAVSVEPGAIWGHVYNEVTTKGGRYVQGGGCMTVGVAGLIQGGGFGSYSKAYGMAAASLLEAEVVTGRRHPDRQRMHQP